MPDIIKNDPHYIGLTENTFKDQPILQAQKLIQI